MNGWIIWELLEILGLEAWLLWYAIAVATQSVRERKKKREEILNEQRAKEIKENEERLAQMERTIRSQQEAMGKMREMTVPYQPTREVYPQSSRMRSPLCDSAICTVRMVGSMTMGMYDY